MQCSRDPHPAPKDSPPPLWPGRGGVRMGWSASFSCPQAATDWQPVCARLPGTDLGQAERLLAIPGEGQAEGPAIWPARPQAGSTEAQPLLVQPVFKPGFNRRATAQANRSVIPNSCRPVRSGELLTAGKLVAGQQFAGDCQKFLAWHARCLLYCSHT